MQDNNNDDDDDSLEEGWKITQEMMETMDRSDWLRKELKNDGGLRQIIFRVMNASDKVEKHGRTSQEEELDRTKADYPPFGNFMDKLLVLAGILERQPQEQGDGELEELAPLGEWLQEHLDREELQQSLALKPIPRRTMPVFEPVENPESSSEDASSSASSSESGSEETSSDEDSDASKKS